MAAEAKIDSAEMLRMLGEGQSQAAIARHFNVSRQAVSRRLKALRGQINPRAPAPVEHEDEPADTIVCSFCGQESPKAQFDAEGYCKWCQWAYDR
jgi:predicted transcriptional regulator